MLLSKLKETAESVLKKPCLWTVLFGKFHPFIRVYEEAERKKAVN